MISGIETTSGSGIGQAMQQMEALRARQSAALERITSSEGQTQAGVITPTRAAEEVGQVTFGSLIGNLVETVDATQKNSDNELKKVMTGQVDNLHQSMIAMQEANVAFTLMVEVRNKLMESYQQIMRMQV